MPRSIGGSAREKVHVEETKAVWSGRAPITVITGQERKEIAKRIKKEREQLRRAYPEVHGKVDFITHTITDGTLYVSVRFTEIMSCGRMGTTGLQLSADVSQKK